MSVHYFFPPQKKRARCKTMSKQWGTADVGILKRNLKDNLTERLVVKSGFFIDANIFSNFHGNSLI